MKRVECRKAHMNVNRECGWGGSDSEFLSVCPGGGGRSTFISKGNRPDFCTKGCGVTPNPPKCKGSSFYWFAWCFVFLQIPSPGFVWKGSSGNRLRCSQDDSCCMVPLPSYSTENNAGAGFARTLPDFKWLARYSTCNMVHYIHTNVKKQYN